MLFSLMTAEVLRVGDRLTAALPVHHTTTMHRVWSKVQPAVQHVYHSMSLSNMAVWILTLVLAYAIYEQFTHMRIRSKGQLPGPKTLMVPIVGGLFHMVLHPYKFWHTQFTLGPISWNSLMGKLLVVTTDPVTSRKIFEKCSEDLPLILHPSAHILLGSNNIAFMSGQEHKDARHRLLPLFTQRALNVYLDIQCKTILEHLQIWFADSKSKPANEGLTMQQRVYNLNTITSMKVFVGPYLDAGTTKKFQKSYTALTAGFLSFPVYFPGTALYEGRQGRLYIVKKLTEFAAQSKQRMAQPDAKPECLLDFWMVNTVKEISEWKAANKSGTPPHSTDHEIACLVLDFLFASQDASTSSLTFTMHLLCEHPDVLKRVREEQARIRPDPHAPIEGEQLPELRYTWQVMREVLRFRPPATMVPHTTKKSFALTDDYTVPAGALLIPSVWSSNRSGFSDPETFDPDRFSAERAEDKKFDKQFLTFGAGPHYCLGQRYAMNHIVAFISLLTTLADFERQQTPTMHDIKYYPTIYPEDGCVLQYIRPRKGAEVTTSG